MYSPTALRAVPAVPPSSAWIILEADVPATLLGRFTVQQPGAAADLILEPALAIDGRLCHPALVMLADADPDTVPTLLRQLAKAWGKPKVLRDALETDDAWVGRFFIPADALGLGPVAALRDACDAPLVHVEAGAVHARARVRRGRAPHETLDGLRAALGASHQQAQCDVQEIADTDLGLWRTLVEYAYDIVP